jgi:hypothetical protein
MRNPLYLAFGIPLSYDVFDFGKRRTAVRGRIAENLGQ